MATQTVPKRQPMTFAVRFQTLVHALMFVLGIALVIVLLFGGAATLFGELLYDYKDAIARVGGIVVMIFGLQVLGVLKIPFLNYDTRKQYTGGTSYGSSVLMGVFFTAGWSPCIGTTFGAIIGLGWSQETVFAGMILAASYALGLGLPFILLGLVVDRSTGILRRLRRYIRAFEIFTGVFLIILGILLVTGQMTQLASMAQRLGSQISPTGSVIETTAFETSNPTIPIAFIAGLLSFLSPCVLPLVPAYLGYLGGRAVNQVAGESGA